MLNMKPKLKPNYDYKKVQKLQDEFLMLKDKIFGNGLFVCVADTPDNRRYDQLLMFFYPEFRTADWINPMKG